MQYTVPLESHCGNLGWTAVKYCCWHGRYAFTVARLPIRYCSVSYADSELPPHKFNLFFSWLNISCHSRENQWKRTVPNKQRAQQSTAEQHECIASNSSWGFFFSLVTTWINLLHYEFSIVSKVFFLLPHLLLSSHCGAWWNSIVARNAWLD